MKFRFLGDGDCPDWLLTEINTLSRFPLMRMKRVAGCVITRLTTGTMPEEVLKNVTEGTNFDFDDVKAVIAALEFIITSAARNGVSHTDLQSELSQLGLPAEHSKLLCSLYQAQATELEIKLTAQSLRINQLSSVKVLPTEEKSPVAKLALKIKSLNNDEENVTINLVKDDIPVLLEELKKARTLMENLKE